MRFLKTLTTPFLRTEIKGTFAQFRDDFGTFPPSPLHCQRNDSLFTIVRVRGIGAIVQDVKLTLRAKDTNPQTFAAQQIDSEELRQLKKKLRTAQQMLAEVTATLDQYRIPRSLQKPLLLTMLTFTATKRYLAREDNRLGYFFPLGECEDQITLMVSKMGTEKSAAVLSHEHIHLLQNKLGVATTRYAQHLADLIAPEYYEEAAVRYHFEEIEVEARLHEIILSFFRRTGRVPVTLGGFFQLLAGCEEMVSAKHALEWAGTCITAELVIYPARADYMAGQVDDRLFVLKDDATRYRFITEVLTVMYANLLNYYGDANASNSFMTQIERPNLYDYLYK